MLEIEEFLWRYIEKYHTDKLQSIFISDVKCSYSNGKLEIESENNDTVKDASEEIICLCQKLADDVVEEAFQLPQDTCEDILWTAVKDLAENDKLLFYISHNSTCHVVGSKDRVPYLKQRLLDVISEGFQKTKEAHMNVEQIAGTSGSAPVTFSMTTPGGIRVEVHQGDLVNETVDAIVNPSNQRLKHGSGAARAIVNAAGPSLEHECRLFISRHKRLDVTKVMHTSAGNLSPKVKYVIHAVGPRASEFSDAAKLFQALRQTFINCLEYANDTLHISSVSIPAISSGTCYFSYHLIHSTL